VKLAILGGSFNPVHMGHLLLADTVLSVLKYDRIILVPAFTSPFKPGAEGASAADRLDMLAASIPGDPRLTIDDSEIRREGVSYTIDTLIDIDNRYRPEGKLGLILGDDLLRDFPQWRRVEEIVSRADIIIAHRISSRELSFPFPYKELTNDIWPLSSGLIRDRIRGRKNWRYLVPPGARLIIEDRGLYGYDAAPLAAPALSPSALSPGGAVPPLSALSPMEPPSGQTIARIEDAVRAMVGPSRFLHSRNTALLSCDLCLRFGLEAPAGYLAGISHDMCKSLTDEELTRFARMDGEPVSKLEQKKPSLLHGRAAAVLLRERFGIHNGDILEAVRLHTSGAAEMGPLAKVLYIADKIEVSRERVSPELRDLGMKAGSPPAGLDTLFTAVVDETVAYLRSRELDLSEGTLRLLEAMHKRRAL
jgi:nicotinate-nucleotide adenylyltransferase